MISSGIGINATSDTSKLLYVISRAVRRVKFETILKYHKWYSCQISRTNHAITYTNLGKTTAQVYVKVSTSGYSASLKSLCSVPIPAPVYFSIR